MLVRVVADQILPRGCILALAGVHCPNASEAVCRVPIRERKFIGVFRGAGDASVKGKSQPAQGEHVVATASKKSEGAIMSAIRHIIAREILDSRGNPTVEVEVTTQSGAHARAE